MSTREPRPARYACGHNDEPYGAKGLCRRCYQRARMHRARAGKPDLRLRANRRRPAVADPFALPARPPFACRGCGTTIRPQHSGGLCTDCVRAAGRLHTDPWEAA